MLSKAVPGYVFPYKFRTEFKALVRMDTKTGRDRSKPRREPYWRKLTQRRYLGFRKSDTGGTWIAGYRTEDRKQRYLSLGEVSHLTYD